MAFSKSRKGSGKQGNSPREMSGEVTSGLGRIMEASLANESQNEMIDRSHDLACVAQGHTGGIFLQCDITTIV